MRTTHALVQVVAALMAAPDDRHWGYELGKQAGVRSGVLYPMLSRLLTEGWLADGWEDPKEIVEKRPPRRYYTVTEKGKAEAGALLARARTDARFAGLKLGWAR
jgi:PadR family transcriptional regulator, regulatory protein PadR